MEIKLTLSNHWSNFYLREKLTVHVNKNIWEYLAQYSEYSIRIFKYCLRKFCISLIFLFLPTNILIQYSPALYNILPFVCAQFAP